MATQFCPECHQPMAEVVAGVRLTVFKAKLYRYIETHTGQSSHMLGGRFDKTSQAIKSHIYQINDALMNTAIRIHGDKWSGYHIKRAKDAKDTAGVDRQERRRAGAASGASPGVRKS